MKNILSGFLALIIFFSAHYSFAQDYQLGELISNSDVIAIEPITFQGFRDPLLMEYTNKSGDTQDVRYAVDYEERPRIVQGANGYIGFSADKGLGFYLPEQSLFTKMLFDPNYIQKLESLCDGGSTVEIVDCYELSGSRYVIEQSVLKALILQELDKTSDHLGAEDLENVALKDEIKASLVTLDKMYEDYFNEIVHVKRRMQELGGGTIGYVSTASMSADLDQRYARDLLYLFYGL